MRESAEIRPICAPQHVRSLNHKGRPKAGTLGRLVVHLWHVVLR